jgi:aminoglycoside 3-N-acetyltransferase
MNLFLIEDRPFSADDFYRELKPIIHPGDVLYIEMDLAKFGKLYDATLSKNLFLQEFLNLFLKLVGPTGTLILPTFSYSWGDDSPSKIFDVKNTKGKTGLFPEYLRTKENCHRTLDPMFSFIAYGYQADYFTNIQDQSFGQESTFEKMHLKNAKLMTFGLPQFDPTFVHYVEQYFHENIHDIGYRFLKKFQGTLVDQDGISYQCEHSALMRYPGSQYFFSDVNLVKDLESEVKLFNKKIGHRSIYVSDCQSVFDLSLEGIKKNLYYLVTKREST